MELYPNTIFLLGAGFTKAVYLNAPLNNKLLNVLINNNCPVLAKYRKKYASIGYYTDDIEKLLTFMDLSDDETAKKDRLAINEEIANYFKQYRFSNYNKETPQWLTTFANQILKNNDAIISLNYDCCLEGYLDSCSIWSPKGGYACVSSPPPGSTLSNPKSIKIFKIHGSENFVESDADLGARGQTAIGYEINESIFPVSGANSHLGGGADNPKTYIIAPSFVKIPHLDIATMMIETLKIAETAKNFVIIGCGMRPEDSFLWLLVTTFLNNSDTHKQLILLDPNAETTKCDLSKYWFGDIQQVCNVVDIPLTLEKGISKLESTLNDK